MNNIPFARLLVTLLLAVTCKISSAQIAFSSLDSLLKFAEVQSISLKTGDIQLIQAKKAKLGALASIPDITGSTALNFTNNTKLPISLFPGEVFGDPPGTFKEIQTGVQYNTAFNQNLDIKLINLAGWQNLQLARTNIEISTTSKQLTRKSLYEDVATTYYNIVQLQEQLKSTYNNRFAADTLYNIANQKYNEGLVNIQDLQEAKVNLLNTEENINQIKLLIKENYLSLNILTDTPDLTNLQIADTGSLIPTASNPLVEYNNLAYSNAMAEEKYARQYLQQTNMSTLPVLSAFIYNSHNQYNQSLTAFGGNWIHSQYIGVKATFTIPNATTISNLYKAKYDLQIAHSKREQTSIRQSNETQKLGVSYEKAYSQFKNTKEILSLRKETYSKNLDLYKEGLISLDDTMGSFNNMVNSEYNMISAAISTRLALAKISINNSIQ